MVAKTVDGVIVHWPPMASDSTEDLLPLQEDYAGEFEATALFGAGAKAALAGDAPWTVPCAA